jgi:hypothetical protein
MKETTLAALAMSLCAATSAHAENFAVTHLRWSRVREPARIWAGAVSNDRPYRASSRAFLRLHRCLFPLG